MRNIKTFEGFTKNPNFDEVKLKNYINSLYELHHQFEQFTELLTFDWIFDLDIRAILDRYNQPWRDKTLGYDSTTKSLLNWIDFVKHLSKIDIPQPFYNIFNPHDIKEDPEEYASCVYLVLKNIDELSKKCTDIFNDLDIRIPSTSEYPFLVPMNELYDNIHKWVVAVLEPIGIIAVRSKVHDIMKKINE